MGLLLRVPCRRNQIVCDSQDDWLRSWEHGWVTEGGADAVDPQASKEIYVRRAGLYGTPGGPVGGGAAPLRSFVMRSLDMLW